MAFSYHSQHQYLIVQISKYYSNNCIHRVHIPIRAYPDSKVHWANMGPTWILPAPDGPHVDPMNLAITIMLLYTEDTMIISVINGHVQYICWCLIAWYANHRVVLVMNIFVSKLYSEKLMLRLSRILRNPHGLSHFWSVNFQREWSHGRHWGAAYPAYESPQLHCKNCYKSQRKIIWIARWAVGDFGRVSL